MNAKEKREAMEANPMAVERLANIQLGNVLDKQFCSCTTKGMNIFEPRRRLVPLGRDEERSLCFE